jgi:hypothetical protein
MNFRTIAFLGAVSIALTACGNAKEDEAKRLGFSDAADMETAQSKGWHTNAQYIADETERAHRFGFTSIDEMHRADDAGVKTKAAYDKYVTDLDAKNEEFSQAEDAKENQVAKDAPSSDAESGENPSESGIKVIPASLISQDVDENKARANDTYSKSTFKIVGYFRNIEDGFNGIFSFSNKRIIITDGSSQIDAYISNSDANFAKRFYKGQLIIVTCSGGDMSSLYPQFHDCSSPRAVNTGGERADLYYDDLVAKYNKFLH